MRGLTQRVLMSIDLEPDAHEVALEVGDDLMLDGRNVHVLYDGTRIGLLPEGISVDDSILYPVVAEVGELVEYAGQTYPMVRVELVRR